MTLVSVIVPTYNRTQLLMERALPSILAQTHRELDIHVVGDDTELATAEAIHVLGDPRVRFTNLPRQAYPEDPGQRWCVLGLEARNYGLNMAIGSFVACLNDDDAWEPDMIEILVEHLDRWDLYLGRWDFVYGVSKYHWPNHHRQQAGKWPPGMGAFCDGAWLMRHDLGYRYDPGCIERGLPEDGDLWTRMYADGVRFGFVDRLVHHYYPNPR